MNLFEDFIKRIDLNNPKFNEVAKVHDWRNYVPYDWQNNWNELTEREKKIIAVMAETQADNEEWDQKLNLNKIKHALKQSALIGEYSGFSKDFWIGVMEEDLAANYC